MGEKGHLATAKWSLTKEKRILARKGQLWGQGKSHVLLFQILCQTCKDFKSTNISQKYLMEEM